MPKKSSQGYPQNKMKDKILKVGLVILSIAASCFIFASVNLFHKGGPVMVPIILSSIFAFAIVLAKVRQFSKYGAPVEKFLSDIFERIERQRIKEAIDLCAKSNTPLSRVLKEGVMKYDSSKDEIKEAMENSFLYEAPILEENLSMLSTIIQIAPLLGFLGTLIGMMKIFLTIQTKGISFTPLVGGDVAIGIWEALICTTSGFFVTVSVLIAYNYLMGRLKSAQEEIERGASDLLIFLMDRRMSA
ncbi:MAG: MotA/TolQ/ExbB proton channel family protein [Candidatus Omnitrophota bacterium]